MSSIFSPIRDQKDLYTWSSIARRRLEAIEDDLEMLETELKEVRVGQPYSLSYAAVSEISPTASDTASWLAAGLYKCKPKGGLMRLADMMFGSPHALHALFALIRAHLCSPVSTAIHSPLDVDTQQSTDFPVHVDLYGPRMLLNIIASSSKGGDILLLSGSKLESILDEVSSVPREVALLVTNALRGKNRSERYDEIFDLLYGSHPWCEEVQAGISRHQLTYPGSLGSGYLIEDGVWLHGRTATSGPVPNDRLQRLVFDSAHTVPELAQSVEPPTCKSPSVSLKKSLRPKSIVSNTLSRKTVQFLFERIGAGQPLKKGIAGTGRPSS